MNVHILIETLQARGLSIEAPDGNLHITPASLLTDDLRAAIRKCKAELLQVLDLENRTREYSAPCPQSSAERQAARIRRLVAEVRAEELLAAYRKIKPLLKKQLEQADLHELALLLAQADQRASTR